MFEFNVSPDLIKAARKELRKNIDSQHAVVKRFNRHVERCSRKHFKKIWIVAFVFVFLIDIFSYNGEKYYFDLSHIAFLLFILFIVPSLVGVVVTNIFTHLFYKKNHIPVKDPVYTPSTSPSFSRSSYSGSTISVNPASGLPMCGSVDVSGNAPGHSRHY